MTLPLQVHSIQAPGFYGLNLQDSSLDVPPGFARTATNCVIDTYGRIGARRGWVKATTTTAALSGANITSLGELISNTGVSYIICTGNSKIFSFSAGALTELTYGGGGVAPTISANNWQVDTLNGILYLFQRGHDPLIFDPAVSTTTYRRLSEKSGYSGTVALANTVLSAYGRLWVADTTTDKNTVQFSDLKTGHIWTGGTSGTLDLIGVWPDGPDEIVTMAAHNGYLYIFGKHQILVYSGANSPSTMALSDSVSTVGCIARDSVQNMGSDMIFLSGTGIRSLLRTVQEKSAPLRDLSKNIRDHLLTDVNTEDLDNVKSVFFDKYSFYLLSLPVSGEVYCFDTRFPLQDGAARVTVWNNLVPKSFLATRSKQLYFGMAGYIGEHSGYLDDTATYDFAYYTSDISLTNNTNLSILKKIAATVIGGSGQQIVFKYGLDFSSSYQTRAANLPAQNVAEYGIAEYGIGEYTSGIALTNLTVNAGGNGKVMQFGFEAIVNGYAISIQKIDIFTKNGKLA